MSISYYNEKNCDSSEKKKRERKFSDLEFQEIIFKKLIKRIFDDFMHIFLKNLMTLKF